MGKTLSDFVVSRSKDRTADIRAYLSKLGGRYVDQLELCRATGVAHHHLAKYRELFVDHLVLTRNAAGRRTHLWAGTVKLAKQMRAVA